MINKNSRQAKGLYTLWGLFILLSVFAICNISCKSKKTTEDALEAFQFRIFQTLPANLHFYISHEDYKRDTASIAIVDGHAYIYAGSVNAACRALGDLIMSTQAGMYTPEGKRILLPDYWPETPPIALSSKANTRAIDLSDVVSARLWSWEYWESLIDYFALQGINTLILPPDPGLVWQKTWEKMEVQGEYMSGSSPWLSPCFFLEQEDAGRTIESRYHRRSQEIMKKIVERTAELGIRCGILAFQGWIPDAMTRSQTGIDAFPVKLKDMDTTLYWLPPESELFRTVQIQYLTQFELLTGVRPFLFYDMKPVIQSGESSYWIQRQRKAMLDLTLRLMELSGDTFYIAKHYSDSYDLLTFNFIETDLQSNDHSSFALEQYFIPQGGELLCIDGVSQGPLERFRPLGGALDVEQIEGGRSFVVKGNLGSWDNMELMKRFYAAWHASLPEPDFETYFCNARYGACKTGTLLALNLGRRAISGMASERSYARFGAHRYVFQLEPSLDWAQLRMQHFNEEQLDLAMRLLLSDWEFSEKNALYLQDVTSLAVELSSYQINQMLQKVLSDQLLLKKDSSDQYLMQARQKLITLKQLLDRSHSISSYELYHYWVKDRTLARKWMQSHWIRHLNKAANRQLHDKELLGWNLVAWSDWSKTSPGEQEYSERMKKYTGKLPAAARVGSSSRVKNIHEIVEKLIVNETR